MIKYDPAQAVVPFLPLFNAFVAPCCTPPTNIDAAALKARWCAMTCTALAASWINDWKLGGDVLLKSITAYRYMHADFGRDGDNSAVNYNGDVHDEHDTQFSEEIQASGSLSRI